MRIRTALVAALPTVLLIGVPLAAHATGIPFFDPIVPDSAKDCAAGFGQLMQVANNIIAFLVTLLILFVTPFMVAWAGFLYVFSPTNPSMRSKANSILRNTAIGVLVALGAWLIVDTFLTTITVGGLGVDTFTKNLFSTDGGCIISTADLNKGFTQDPAITSDTSSSGTTAISAAQACADHKGESTDATEASGTGTALCADGTSQPTSVTTGSTLTNTQACAGHGDGTVSQTGEGNTGGSSVVCSNGDIVCTTVGATTANDCTVKTSSTLGDSTTLNTYGTGGGCDANIVSSAASDAGYTLTTAQADTLACISNSEDACGTGSVKNTLCWNKACPNSSSGSASTAAGAYQVLMSTNSNCYDNSVCETAAGTSGTALNCKSGFDSKGFEKTDSASQTTINNCLTAAKDTRCAAAAAACLVVTNNGSFSAWSSAADNKCKS